MMKCINCDKKIKYKLKTKKAFYILNKALFIVILITQMKIDISMAEHASVFSDNTTGPGHLAYP